MLRTPTTVCVPATTREPTSEPAWVFPERGRQCGVGAQGRVHLGRWGVGALALGRFRS